MAYVTARRSYLLFTAFVTTACSSVAPSPCAQPLADDVVYIVAKEWHAEIGIPAEKLDENMSFYRDVFPYARAFMFSYGKKTFFTMQAETISEYLLGPIPGPAVIQTVALHVMPVEAYPHESTVTLLLPPGGAQALSAYIWQDLVKDPSGKPQVVAHSANPAGLFYAARSQYNLFHTCNTWIADALHATGLPVSSGGVIFVSQIMSRVYKAAEGQCLN